jgi:glycosyltransferase involved in cell wall biosynthesis
VIAANGADPAAWLPDVRQDADTVLFPAHLRYLPNVDAVEFLVTDIWPEVLKRKPTAMLIIAGRDPEDSVITMTSAARRVQLIASPKSMERVARKASISVAPLRLGSGTRHKILESMSWGLPVVSTTLGYEGIEASDGEHLLVRDDPKEFAEAIVRLMSDAALWRKLRYAGRDLVRERYSWDRVFEPLEEALIDLVS